MNNPDVNCLKRGKTPDSCILTVIMPVYQCVDYLEEALDSLLDQNIADFELICIDDGSTDGSTEVLLDYAEKDERLSVYQQPHHGVGDARNVGIKMAVGKYLYFIDSDDILMPFALEKMITTAEKMDLDMLCFEADHFYENTCTEKELKFQPIYRRQHTYPECTEGENLFVQFCENREYYVPLWMMLCKRSLVVQNKLLFYSGVVHGDNVFFYNVIIRAKKAGYLKEALYNRRIRPGSIMTSGDFLRSSYSYAINCNLLWKNYVALKGTMSTDARKWSIARMDLMIQQSINEYRKAFLQNGEETRAEDRMDTPFDKLIAQRVETDIKYENNIRRMENTLQDKERELQEITNSRLYRILCQIRRVYRSIIKNK